ncbi:MAG: S8 family serine peptidase, partial [Candidatus Heimdallarchaeota archaeon]|nr:S8 family serine peptidase [Candidatus Heimdallarchaeota archaeon]
MRFRQTVIIFGLSAILVFPVVNFPPDSFHDNDLESRTSNADSDRFVSSNMVALSIQRSVEIADKNFDKIADYIDQGKSSYNLLLTFNDAELIPMSFDISGLEIVEYFENLPIVHVKLTENQLDEISKLPGLAIIDENVNFEKQLAYSTSQLGVRPYIWDTGLTGSNQFSIAILDTGIDRSHSAFKDRIIATWNALNDNRTAAFDVDGHGTHVAGIAAGLPVSDPGIFTQTSRGELTPAGFFWADMGWPNVNESVTIEVGLDWGDPGVDTPGGEAWIGVIDWPPTGNPSSACSGCIEYDSTGEFTATFTLNPSVSEDYYIGIGNTNAVEGLPYEAWARLSLDSEIPSQLNGDGYASHSGVAPGTNIVAIKVLDNQGVGSATDLISALSWVAKNKLVYNITVINLSLGFDSLITPVNVAIDSIVVEDGIIAVIAAGNSGKDSGIFSPGSAAEAITVGALNRFNEVAYYSSTGTEEENPVMKPDVLAPGGSSSFVPHGFDTSYLEGVGLIVSPDSNLVGNYNESPHDLIGYQGTSMAAPHIAGLAALLVQAMESTDGWDWQISDVRKIKRSILSSTFEVVNIGSAGGEGNIENGIPDQTPSLDRTFKDYTEGWGAVNGFAAYNALTRQIPLNDNLIIEMSLEDPFISNVASWNFHAFANEQYTFLASVPGGADFDLLIFDLNSGQFGEPTLRYSSTLGVGLDEQIIFEETLDKELTLVVRIVDSLNSMDQITISLLNPDFVPNVQIEFPKDGSFINNADPIVRFSSQTNMVDTFLDDNFLGVFSSGDNLSELSEGTHNLTIVETNPNLQLKAISTSIFTLDLTKPVLTSDLSGLENGEIFSESSVNFSLTDNFEVDRVDLIIDGQLLESVSGNEMKIRLNPTSFDIGNHIVILKGFDKAGNFQALAANITFSHQVFLDLLQDLTIQIDEGLTLFWGASSTNPNKFQIYLDQELIAETNWDGTDISYVINFQSLGTHIVELLAFDNDGGFGRDTIIVEVLDNIPPRINLLTGNRKDASTSQVFEFEVIEALPQSVQIFVDEILTVDVASWDGDPAFTKVQISGIPGQSTNLTIIARDTSGNSRKRTTIVDWFDLSGPDLVELSDIEFVQGQASQELIWTWVEPFISEITLSLDNQELSDSQYQRVDDFTIKIPFSQLNMLEAGIHIAELIIDDTVNRIVVDVVTITVLPNTDTTSKSEDSGFLQNFSV